MRDPSVSRSDSLVGLALAMVLAAGSATALTWPAVADAASVQPVGPRAAQAGAPQRALSPVAVAVDAIGVTSGLVDLGLNPDRTLQVPDDPAVAGWYVGAARPGEPGPVVVVGHVDSRTGPGVFARLLELVPGDRIDLELADGAVASYEVTALRQVPKDAFPTEEVYGAVPGDELRLITCGGTFDRAQRSYRDNVVVSAVRV